jgi:hypothetical protein
LAGVEHNLAGVEHNLAGVEHNLADVAKHNIEKDKAVMDGTTDSRKGIQKQKEGEYRAQRI